MVLHHGAERYPDPEHSWSEIVVFHPNPELDEPPATDEGEVLDVDFEYYNVLAHGKFKRCQVCRTSIEWASPHVWVFVYLYAPEDSAMGGNFKRVHLCDRECWGRWASRSGGE